LPGTLSLARRWVIRAAGLCAVGRGLPGPPQSFAGAPHGAPWGGVRGGAPANHGGAR
jgi:hypothetical protein